MATVFTMIIDGDLPARFVWRDEVCVGFLSINPLAPGHTLVVPRREVDHWLDLDAATLAHVVEVGRIIGAALQDEFHPVKVGLIVAGLEVPHVHLHLVPIRSESDLEFANAERTPDPAALDAAATAIRRRLAAAGRTEVADA
jgi:histidine triad (HIT) family protein